MKDFNQKYFTGDSATHSRSVHKESGYDPQDLNRPHIGIASTFSENSAGHVHLGELAAAAKGAIWQAGGAPFKLGLPSIYAGVAIDTDVMCMDLTIRNIVASGIEVVSSIQHFDGLAFLFGCGNVVPGILLAAARPNILAICCTGGLMLPGHLDGKQFLQCDVTEFLYGQILKGIASKEAILKTECSVCPSVGACPSVGTVNTMQVLTEALGMTLPGTSAIPAVFADKIINYKQVGRGIVGTIHENLIPSRIITREAIENAIYMDLAIDGSTSAVLYLLAPANEPDIELSLQDFEKLSYTTPCIANVCPNGVYAAGNLFYSGGMPTIFKQLKSAVHRECLNVNGRTLDEILSTVLSEPDDVVRSLGSPIVKDGESVVLLGNPALNGCVVRSSTVKESIRHFRGTAKVFSSDSEIHDAIIQERVRPGDIIVARHYGPVGMSGMVEIMEAIEAIVNLGLDGSVALTIDGRFSGLCHGSIIGHVSPEVAIGGTIALVEDGDLVDIGILGCSLTLLVPDEGLEERQKGPVFPEPDIKKGLMHIYVKNCLPPERGAAVRTQD